MRRTSLYAGLAAVSLLLAACGSSSSSSGSTSAAATSAAGSSAEASGSGSAAGGAGGDVEVFTWWADGSEKAGLDALVGVFEKEFPNDTFVNGAVAGGAGSNAKAVLASRLQNQDPPSTFQGHAGAELTDYITNGQIDPVNDIIAELGGAATFPQNLLDRLTVDGQIYSVPSNIHRANMVWANPKLLTAAGITEVPATMQAWIADMEKVKASGIATPLAIGGTWTQVQLLETVLLSDLGADAYSGLFDGTTSWASAEVTAALNDFKSLLSYTNAAADGDDWPGAIDAVIDGTAAYNVMGDWAVAQFNTKSKVDGTDYTYFPVPGTDGVFDFLADSFTLPVGAKNGGGAKDWLLVVGSADGQKAFNIAKGSIPARSDVVAADYPTYQQTAIKSWTSDTIVSSIAHGAAVPLAWNADISTAVSKFYNDPNRDVATLQADLVTAAQANGGS